MLNSFDRRVPASAGVLHRNCGQKCGQPTWRGRVCDGLSHSALRDGTETNSLIPAAMRWACAAVIVLFTACGGGSNLARVSASPRTPGPLGDTWISNGFQWEHVRVNGPEPRYLAGLAYDAPRHVFVLFGGQTLKGSSDDTWTWDPTRSKWTEMSPAHKPPPRRDAAMAYDPEHQVVVLYGGRVADQAEGHPASDTWIWNGRDWAEVSEGNSGPGNRAGPRMVTAGNRVLMFGGSIGNASYFGDAWAWDGVAWSRIDHGPAPQGRGDAAIAWDPDDSSLFIYGGLGIRPDAGPGNLGLPLGDAWSLKNGAWRQLPAPGRPVAAEGNAIWDRQTKSVVVMFGIACPEPTTSGSSWDGSKWSSIQVGVNARWGAAVAQDLEGNVLVFGGSDERGC